MQDNEAEPAAEDGVCSSVVVALASGKVVVALSIGVGAHCTIGRDNRNLCTDLTQAWEDCTMTISLCTAWSGVHCVWIHPMACLVGSI